ncbi:MAG: hypothetical protein HQ543_06795 [Bacteroidetes bacterium]|nr:hypothetical protein [Bacteroidota bacterium]
MKKEIQAFIKRILGKELSKKVSFLYHLSWNKLWLSLRALLRNLWTIFRNYKMRKKVLIVICSKGPSPYLLTCMRRLNIFYPFSNIVIIDSDSEKTSEYKRIKRKNISVHFSKNKNYEFGAYKIAYNIYPNYDIYICIQDSLIPTEPINLTKYEENSVYLWPNDSGFIDHLAIKEKAKALIKGTPYQEHFLKVCNEKFSLATHNSFIISNATLKRLIKTLPNLPDDKEGACSYERLLGIVFTHNKNKTLNLGNYFYKVHERRE